MHFRQFGNICFFFTLFLYFGSTNTEADVLVESDGTHFGRILQITDEGNFIFAPSCNESRVKTFVKGSVKFHLFDANCKAHPFKLPTSPFQLCDQEKIKGYNVIFTDGSSRFADDVRLKNGRVLLIFYGQSVTLQGPAKVVKSITAAQVCPSSITDEINAPTGYCKEPFGIQRTDFSVKPIFNNQIFTNGLTVFFEEVGSGKSDLRASLVSEALGNALMMWMSALQDIRPTLVPPLSGYVDSLLHKAGNHTVLIPPQVLQVHCKDNAVMIVRFYKVRDEQLFPEKARYVAKAQLEGRTILLNGVDFGYRNDLNTSDLVKEAKINLVILFAHELGHSFGLPDADKESHKLSIMNVESVVRNLVGRPQKIDGLDFAAILKKTVRGSGPGVFNPSECTGFKFPSIKPLRRVRKTG